MPQTVPNRPMNGVALPVVARKETDRAIRSDSRNCALRTARLRLSMVASCISRVAGGLPLLRAALIFFSSL